jgi:hypothetical protein
MRWGSGMSEGVGVTRAGMGHYEKPPVMRSSGLANGLMACMSLIDPLVHFS